MSLSHWDWRVSGCCLEGMESRNCLAGLRDVCAPMGVSARLLEEVSYETLVLQCEFLRKPRTKRSFWRLDAQPSAEIVRVECAKYRRECDLSHARATLCGDRACRVREMQARDGESAICPTRAQPSAEIVRVERAKCRRECDLSGARATLCGDRACRAAGYLGSWKMRTGDLVVQLQYAEQSVELEAENWRLCSTTLSHKSVLQECPTGVSYKSAPQEYPTRVSYKSVPEECPTRVSYNSAPEE